jgi:hypothetical protein
MLPGDLVLIDRSCYCRKVGSGEEDWFFTGTMGIIVWTSPYLTETENSVALVYGVLFGARGVWYVEDVRLVKADEVKPREFL